MNTVIITAILICLVESKHLKVGTAKKLLLFFPIVFSVWTISHNISQNPKPFSTDMLIAGISGIVILALCLYVPSFFLFKFVGQDKKEVSEKR